MENCIKIFMDDFTIFGTSFDECLINLENVLKRCVGNDLVLNHEKCHFVVDKGIMLAHARI